MEPNSALFFCTNIHVGHMPQEQKPTLYTSLKTKHSWVQKCIWNSGILSPSHGKLNLYSNISHLVSHLGKKAFCNHSDFAFVLHKIHHTSKQTISISRLICPCRTAWRLRVFSTGAVKSSIPLLAYCFICVGMQRSGARPLQRHWIAWLMTSALSEGKRTATPLYLGLSPLLPLPPSRSFFLS